MATAKLFDQKGTENGTQDLPKELFDAEVNESVIHQAVVAYLANQRQGNASSKGRSDVRGGGRKPFRQKGTGRARQGTSRSPIHRGGGVVFGPHQRDYRQAFPKKMRRRAIVSSLSTHAKDNSVMVVTDLEYAGPKTKDFATMLKAMDSYQQKVLFVMANADEAVFKSARNIKGLRIRVASSLSTYDVMWADKVVVTQGGLQKLQEVFK
jgi:large subunit ribosomal protein L4